MSYKDKRLIVGCFPAGVENGQTVRMSVGKKEILITFRVSRVVSLHVTNMGV